MKAPSIAIVGSGPSGCYLSQFLRKSFPESKIAIIDRLSQPFGLARYGVAPDHLGTRALMKQFERSLEKDGIELITNTEIGRDKSLEELRSEYQIVVLAAGLSQDRKLGIPGEETAGVFGSGEVTRLINGHPEELVTNFKFSNSILIVGNGNVSIDLIRIFLTSKDLLLSLGVATNVLDAINIEGIEHIQVVGRSEISNAKFDTAMLKELGKIKDVDFFVANEAISNRSDEKSRAVKALVDNSSGNSRRAVYFHFDVSPTEIRSNLGVKTVAVTASSGQDFEIKVGNIITAIGFEESDKSSIKKSNLLNSNSDIEAGYLDKGLYCVGWYKRGPQGTIPANRADAKIVCDRIVADFESSLR